MITGASPAGAYSLPLFIVSDRPRKSIQLICYTAFHQPAVLCDSSKSLLLFLIGLKHYLLVVKHNKPFWINCQPLFLSFANGMGECVTVHWPYSAKSNLHAIASQSELLWTAWTVTQTPPMEHPLSSSLRVPRNSSGDERIRGIPREPWFLLRYDRSYGTPIL